jgi:acetolactate synthase I/II/III large subunit
MRVVDAIAECMKREGISFLSCYPTTPIIDACASAGIRPYLCRQERVGAGIADGYARVTNGNPPAAFAMQYGPGAENAFPGVATAFSDSTPILCLPLGHPRDRAQVYPLFSSARTYAAVTKNVETLNLPGEVGEVMRRAFSLLRMGRPGPVMVEIPADVALEEVPDGAHYYTPVKTARSAADEQDVDQAAKALLSARRALILAGQGVLYAGATDELLELAELLQIPVTTTMEGKSAFPEDHALALGSVSGVMSGPAQHFFESADVILAVGTSLTKHGMVATLPSDRTVIHATNDERDLNKSYEVQYPVLGDAKAVLRQFLDACKDLMTENVREVGVTGEIAQVRESWLTQWLPKLTSDEVPLNPYRVMWDFINTVDAAQAIVTHDSGSPRDQLMPFYRARGPRTYLGWGKSHALGTGLGLNMGAKLAAPDKFCVNFMGDAAFGMTGLDFETAVRNDIPITTIVLNNFAMAIERHALVTSHDLYRVRDIGGDYADMARSMGGYAERIETPQDIVSAIKQARRQNEAGRPVLLEFITSQEIEFSNKRR